MHNPSDGRSWGFEKREYYPPPDPINALLSFGYTLLLQDLVAVCQIVGLDPDLGFFHATDYNKPAMALDLEEEFRPIIVDSIVLTAANRPLFALRDFTAGRPTRQNEEEEETGEQPAASPAHPVYLTDAARKRFIALYEARLNETILYPPTNEQTSYRRIFELQAYAMARLILGETPEYTAFTVR